MKRVTKLDTADTTKTLICKNCGGELYHINRDTPDDWFLACDGCNTTVALIPVTELLYYDKVKIGR